MSADRAPESPLLEDPDGAPYPETVQRFVDQHIDHGHIGFGHDPARLALVEALEAVRAIAIAEHTSGAQLAEAERDERLLDIFLAGFVSGSVHLGGRVGISPAVAYVDAKHTTGHVKADPIARTQVIDEVLVKWLTGEEPPGGKVVTAYGFGHDHEEDQG